MALTKAQKKQILEELKEKIGEQKIMIFVDFTGLKTKDLFSLRKKLKRGDGQLKVAKKTLLRLAFKEKGFEVDIKKLKGEVAVVFGFKDEISLAKTIYEFSVENPNLKILGGFFETSFIDPDKVIELAKLPTKEELFSRLISGISAPVSDFINILKGNLRAFISVLSQIKVNQ